MYAPPPRDTWEKWAAFGAVAIVAVSVSFGAHAVKRRLKPPPSVVEAPVAAPTASAPPTIADEPDVEDETPALAADDEPAPEPGTPSSSLRARPTWGRLEIGVRGTPTVQYAPQHSRPLDLFLRSAPLSGDVVRGLVICRAQTWNKADTFAGDDLHLRATFGGMPEAAADGPEDGNLAFVSAPLVTLKKGDKIALAVFDRDVFELTPLSRTTLTRQDGPLSTMDQGAAIECRELSGAALQQAVAIDTAAADVAIASLGRRELSGRTYDWGWPLLEIARARRTTGDAAALVGWDDARVKKRVTSTDQAVARLEAQRPRVFDDLYATAGTQTTVGDLDVAFVACVGGTVKLRLRNAGTRAVRVGAYDGPRVYVATSKSGPVGASPEPFDVVTKDIAPGAELEASFRPLGVDLGAAIAGICVAERCGVVRVR